MIKRNKMFLQLVIFALLLWPRLFFGQARENKTSLGDEPDAAVTEFRFDNLEALMRVMPEGPEKDYFAGVLANRVNHNAESIRLLIRALPTLRSSRPDRAAAALQSLVDNYNKSFRYADAAKADDELLSRYPDQLLPEQLQGVKDDAGIAHILSNSPPQTVTWNGPLHLKTEIDPLGDVDTNLTVNGVRAAWLLDTGANLSVVSKSFAKRLGLTLLPGVAQTQAGLTGIENPLRLTLIPSLHMGGATLHNVVVMVLDDASLMVGTSKDKYQINAILGYPVFQSLGIVTFLHSGWFVAGQAHPADGKGAPMYLKGLSPVVKCRVEGVELPFALDTGASATILFMRYFHRFAGESALWLKADNETYGAGGVAKREVYTQALLDLGIGEKSTVLRNVTIYPTETGTDNGDLYGNLGRDVVGNFDSFTFDFTTMKFLVGEPLVKHSE